MSIDSSNDLTWTEKYRPQTLNELFLSNTEITTIKKWIKDFKNKSSKFKNCLFLHGSPGLGKTTVANIILNENDFDVLEFNSSEIRNQKLIRDKLSKVNGNINIIDCMCMKKRYMGVIFDEIDGLSSGEKSGITEITSIIFDKTIQNKNTPFICISNTLSKKIEAIKKKSIYVKINRPTKNTLTKILERICKSEKLKIKDTIKTLIVDNSNLDIRRLINMTEFLFNRSNDSNNIYNSMTDDENITKLIEQFQSKNIYLTSYEATDKILNKYNSIDDTLLIYDFDKTNIGMFIFENFINYLTKNRKGTNLEKLKNLSNIYETFSQSDLFDYHIFIKQKYELTDINCVMKCCNTSHIINSMKRYSCNKFNNLNYSTLINKSSQEYLNSKYIGQIKLHFNNCCYTDNHIMICDILLKYIENHYDTLRNIIQYYNIDKDLFEKILKFSSFFNENTLIDNKGKIKDLFQ
jgi:DNA polymerase III delta prime subunit